MVIGCLSRWKRFIGNSLFEPTVVGIWRSLEPMCFVRDGRGTQRVSREKLAIFNYTPEPDNHRSLMNTITWAL